MQFNQLVDEIAAADSALKREEIIRTIHVLGEILSDASRRREQVLVEGVGLFSPCADGMKVLQP